MPRRCGTPRPMLATAPIAALGIALACLGPAVPTTAASVTGGYGDSGGPDATVEPPTAADFVIIGGGTAGCALAARLCENLPDASIVLLERAVPRTEEEELFVRAPRLTYEAWGIPGVTEAWETEPNPGLLGRRVVQYTGRTLGGSSAINAAQWTKPPLATFDSDKWAFSGLSSEKAGELYLRAETQLQVSQPSAGNEQTLNPEYLAAAAAAGIPTDPDPRDRTGPVTDGIWSNLLTVDQAGRRVDSCTGYLSPVTTDGGACMHNLQLLESVTVSKILVEGGRAVGVRYTQTAPGDDGEEEREIAASKEVVSSAGPYGSPQLLQVSGIGPGEVLEGLGVPQVVELPVGESCVARGRQGAADLYTAPLVPEGNITAALSPESIAQFMEGRGGILAVAVTGTSGRLAEENSYTLSGNINAPAAPENAILSVCGVNPTARGTLRAPSTDLRQSPVISTNFLGTPADVRNAVACATRMAAVNDELPESLGVLPLVPPANISLGTPEFEGLVRGTADTIYHYGGGCAVGSVVDGEFRVEGVEGLRVVDASVLPELPPFAGPMATVYMLAELAAETITAAHEQ